MFIQIFTTSVISQPKEYYLRHAHYLNGWHLETKHLIWGAENKLIADLCNIGFAMKENIEQDRKIGIVHREFNFISVYKGQKAAYEPKTWTEYKGGVRRNVTVYTDNEQLYNDIKTGFLIGNAYETRLFLRVLQLKNDFNIGIGYLAEKDVTPELQELWATQYKYEIPVINR